MKIRNVVCVSLVVLNAACGSANHSFPVTSGNNPNDGGYVVGDLTEPIPPAVGLCPEVRRLNAEGVQCQIGGSGSPRQFSATAQQPVSCQDISGATLNGSITVTLSATIPQGATAQSPTQSGSVDVKSDVSCGISQFGPSSEHCQFWLGDPNNLTIEHLTSDFIWGYFTCVALVDSSTSPNHTCSISEAQFQFYSCTQT